MEIRSVLFGKNARRGFTLIELLVVIAIIAIITVVVILVLNPAELLRQSRDSNRLSDQGLTIVPRDRIELTYSALQADALPLSYRGVGNFKT